MSEKYRKIICIAQVRNQNCTKTNQNCLYFTTDFGVFLSEGGGGTQQEIAKAPGVSKTTVSRAISGKGRIGDGIRNKILKYVKDHQIEANGILPTRIGICEAAAYMDYNVLVMKVAEGDISKIINVVEKKKIDAVILTRCMKNDRAMRYQKKQYIYTGKVYDNVLEMVMADILSNKTDCLCRCRRHVWKSKEMTL